MSLVCTESALKPFEMRLGGIVLGFRYPILGIWKRFYIPNSVTDSTKSVSGNPEAIHTAFIFEYRLI